MKSARRRRTLFQQVNRLVGPAGLGQHTGVFVAHVVRQWTQGLQSGIAFNGRRLMAQIGRVASRSQQHVVPRRVVVQLFQMGDQRGEDLVGFGIAVQVLQGHALENLPIDGLRRDSSNDLVQLADVGLAIQTHHGPAQSDQQSFVNHRGGFGPVD